MADKLIAAVVTVGQPPDQILEVGGVMGFDQNTDLPTNKCKVVRAEVRILAMERSPEFVGCANLLSEGKSFLPWSRTGG